MKQTRKEYKHQFKEPKYSNMGAPNCKNQQNTMEWIKFKDKLPTEIAGEQVKILFDNPKWSSFFVGLYNHDPELTLKENIWEYKYLIDKYSEWNKSFLPTHYFITERSCK